MLKMKKSESVATKSDWTTKSNSSCLPTNGQVSVLGHCQMCLDAGAEARNSWVRNLGWPSADDLCCSICCVCNSLCM